MIAIPREYLGREGTTYIYQGKHDPTSATIYICGDRCIWMWAYKNPSGYPPESPEPSAFYQCPVSISVVNNASLPQHSIPDGVAKIAAASIALQGRFAGPVNDPDYKQYQFYASGWVINTTIFTFKTGQLLTFAFNCRSAWEIHHKDADQVGENFAKFALGSIATMATLNPPIQVPGHVPNLGHKLQIYEPYFAILLPCIAGAHFAIFVATVFWMTKAGNSGADGIEMRPAGEQTNESQENLVWDIRCVREQESLMFS